MFDETVLWLLDIGAPAWLAVLIGRLSGLLLTLLATGLTYIFSRWFIQKYIRPFIYSSDLRWDNFLSERRILDYIYWILPALVFYTLIPFAFQKLTPFDISGAVLLITQIFLIGLFTLGLNQVINAARDTVELYEFAKEMPVAGFAQILKILLFIGGILIGISIFLSEQPWIVLSSFSAFAAVLSFVYQDALRGLVAGIQLTWNKLLARGDWIEMPAYNVSGTVMEIGLTTVKIQNFDYSVTAVPTNALITDALKNWRGMLEAEGRRMIRSLIIDAHSVRFCDDPLFDKLAKLQLIQNEVTEKRHTLPKDRPTTEISTLANLNQITNLGLFRQYFYNYVHNHPQINTEMTLIVSVLPQTEKGIPVQLLAFSKEKGYADFVQIQGEIFDHLMAVLPQFDLRLFQTSH